MAERLASFMMTGLGHSRRFGRTTATSGLPRRTDILRIDGHVSKVNKSGSDVLNSVSDAVLQSAAKVLLTS